MVTYSIERIIDRGRNESNRLGRAESVLILLEDLGNIPADLRSLILNEKDMDTLKLWLRYAKKAQSVDEFEQIIAAGKTES